MTKTFRHIVILLVTLSIGFGVGYFYGRKLLHEDLEKTRQGYQDELSTLDSLRRVSDSQLLTYQEKVVSLDKELKRLKRQVVRERKEYEDIKPKKTTNEVVKSLKQIVNEKD